MLFFFLLHAAFGAARLLDDDDAMTMAMTLLLCRALYGAAVISFQFSFY